MLYATASGEIYFCMLQTLAKSISKNAADSGEIYCWMLGTQGEIYCSRLDSMGCLLLVLQYTRLQPVVAGEEFVLNSVFILDVDLPCRLSVFKLQIGTGTDTVILTQCHGHCTVHCTPNSEHAQMKELGRGLTTLPDSSSTVLLCWRYKSTQHIYRCIYCTLSVSPHVI